MANPGEKTTAFGWLNRLLRYRLMIPIHRGNREDPRPVARGVAVGLFIAMTPTVGVQMLMVAAVWAVLRWLTPGWRFSLVVALAWVWVTNIVTLPVIYYAFLVTGRLMLGAEASFGGFDMFAARIAELLSADAGVLEAFWVYTVGIVEIWGLPMFLGALLWAAASAWLGHAWTLALLRRLNARRARRMARAAARGKGAQRGGTSGAGGSASAPGDEASESEPPSDDAGAAGSDAASGMSAPAGFGSGSASSRGSTGSD